MQIVRLRKEFVFDMHNAPTLSCHASTIARLDDGRLCTAWFGGTKEGADDVRIWVSVYENGVWESPREIEGNNGIPHWNPVLYVNDAGELLLFYKVGKTIHSWCTYVCVSNDGGKSFSYPKELVSGDVGGRGPVKNKPIRLSNGTLAAPASIETPTSWTAFVDISEDDGRSWSKHTIPLSVEKEFKRQLDIIQPTLWESSGGKVHAICRTNRGYAYRSDSCDFGRSWSEPYITTVPNNNSGLDLARLDNGSLALVSNPIARHFGPRTPLTLSISENNGNTFDKILTLEDTEGEYSYPAIIADKNRLYITYTYQRKNIAFVIVDLDF